MPVSVRLSGLADTTLSEIRAALEHVECGTNHWEVLISPCDETEWSMAISGPENHRRVYRLRPDQNAHLEPICLAAIVRAEIRSFPSCPPFTFGYALAELARQGIPYDDSDSFSGYITVNGERISSERLMKLYRDNNLNQATIGLDPDASRVRY